MNAKQQIEALFGDTSVWNIQWGTSLPNDTKAAILCGSEHVGTLLYDGDPGQWYCLGVTGQVRPSDLKPATNIMTALMNHVGGGLQNTLTNKTRAELRKVMVGYFERSVMSKAPKS